MPYITDTKRIALKGPRKRVFSSSLWEAPTTPGELNYIFTINIIDYMDLKGLNYQTINDIMGALEGAKLEFYRRIVAPYEDKKIEENGDVYDG